jgi:hypothetical protein
LLVLGKRAQRARTCQIPPNPNFQAVSKGPPDLTLQVLAAPKRTCSEQSEGSAEWRRVETM